jgi:hypothetical protein
MSMNRMSRVITFRLPTAPGWKVQFNMNDQHFTLMRFSEVIDHWQAAPEMDWRGARRELTLREIESEAEEKLRLESMAWNHDLAADALDGFTDHYPSL